MVGPAPQAGRLSVAVQGRDLRRLHADVPITGDHGAVVAEVVATSSTPAIVDTRQMTVGERTRFFTDFAEALLRKNRGPLNLVIDEAHVFAPQGTRAADPMSGKMLHAANNLVSLGRSSGAAHQPDHAAAGEAPQGFAHPGRDDDRAARHPPARPSGRGSVDQGMGDQGPGRRDRVVAALAADRRRVDMVAGGRAARALALPARPTFDSGKPLEEMPELAPIDLNTVHAMLGKAAETLEANDPKALQRRIAQLENQLRHAAPAPDYPDQRDLVERQQDEIKRLRLHINALLERAASIAAMEPPPTIIIATEDGIELPSQFPRHIRGQTVEEAYVVPEKVRGDGKLNAAALDLAALLKGAGDSKAYAWDSLLVMGGYRPNSGWIRKARTDLLENGLMEVDGAFVRPTDKLRADSLVTARRPPTPAELRELWTAKLRGPGGKMASWLSKYGPASRAEIAAGCGFSSNAGWTRKGFKDLLGSNLAHDRGETLAPNPLLVD
jgi:hypothetical protein